MATTVADIITTRVRKALNDVVAQPNDARWNDTKDLIPFLADGQNIIFDQRSEELLNADGITQKTVVEPTALTDVLQVSDKWRLALMHYVCARAFEMPGKQRMNIEAANYHSEQFWKMIETL